MYLTGEKRQQAETLFQEAADLAPGERPNFLDEQCRDDPGLRAEIESLLACLEDESVTALEAVEQEDRPEEDQIGPYRIQHLLGEGGFGAVFLAEQSDPIQRSVALKVIKLGMDSKQVIARFEAERQALALMDHPHIARVLDAGSTPTGRPYFVMEHVQGVSITKYCDQKGASVKDRIALVYQVCLAVQHAHQKGIIHRDLKPSNVLVGDHDGVSVPKVIDFGIAKAVDRRLTERSFFTEFRQFVGTPEYMSPEQADDSGLDVDTRTDVYSLGVLLYELLTGRTPLEHKTLEKASYGEIQRRIREEPAPTPSRRVSRLGGEIERVAHARRLSPQSLRKKLRGDLDWIVMKALEKDRNRRYDSAAALAADLKLHLNHEPVQAGPPSKVYRIRKFVRRHRVGVTTTGLILLAVLTGLALATVGLVQANRARAALVVERDEAEAARKSEAEQRRNAEAARTSEAEQRKRAEANAAAAQRVAATAEAVTTFLQEMLQSVKPGERPASEVTVQRMLDGASKRLEAGALAGQPEVENVVRSTLGHTYLMMGQTEASAMHLRAVVTRLERTHGSDHPDTLRAKIWLVGPLLQQRRDEESEQLMRDVVEISRRRLGEEHEMTAAALCCLGVALRNLKRNKEAATTLRKATKLMRRIEGEEGERFLMALTALASVIAQKDGLPKAIPLLRKLLEIRIRVNGEDHLYTANLMMNLAPMLAHTGHADEAGPMIEQAVKVYRRLWGYDHPSTLSARFKEVLVIQEADLDAARQRQRKLLEAQRRVLGPDHPNTQRSEANLETLRQRKIAKDR